MKRFEPQAARQSATAQTGTGQAQTGPAKSSAFRSRLDQLLHKQAVKQGISPTYLQGLLKGGTGSSGLARAGTGSNPFAGLLSPGSLGARPSGGSARTGSAHLGRLRSAYQSLGGAQQLGRGGPATRTLDIRR